MKARKCMVCSGKLVEDFEIHPTPPLGLPKWLNKKTPDGSHCPGCGIKYVFDSNYVETGNEVNIR